MKPNLIYTASVARHYDDFQGPVFFEPFAIEIASRIDAAVIETAIEIACGTGRVTRHLRKTLQPSARLIATDISPDMIDVAREKLKDTAIEWQVADAQDLPFDDECADLVVCAFGYMFPQDKVRAFSEAYRVLKPGGKLLFTSWDLLELNGASHVQRIVMKSYLGELPAVYNNAFLMNDDGEIGSWLKQAGFDVVDIERVDKTATAASAKDVTEGLAQGGSLYNELMKRNPDWVPEVKSKIEAELVRRFGDKPFSSPMRAVFVTATK